MAENLTSKYDNICVESILYFFHLYSLCYEKVTMLLTVRYNRTRDQPISNFETDIRRQTSADNIGEQIRTHSEFPG